MTSKKRFWNWGGVLQTKLLKDTGRHLKRRELDITCKALLIWSLVTSPPWVPASPSCMPFMSAILLHYGTYSSLSVSDCLMPLCLCTSYFLCPLGIIPSSQMLYQTPLHTIYYQFISISICASIAFSHGTYNHKCNFLWPLLNCKCFKGGNISNLTWYPHSIKRV